MQHNEERKVLGFSSLVEMGERYVFYMIQTLLVFYLIHQLHLSQVESATLAGTVFGLVYISALIGGCIADRLLGFYMAIFVGSVVMIFGAWLMTGVHSKDTLFFGLAFVSISSGLIKSNISSLIGEFYDRAKATEGERDFGFNIFYVGMNLGIVAATFLASYLSHRYGFATTFYSCLGVSIFVFGIVILGFFALKQYCFQKRITLSTVCMTALLMSGYIAFVFCVLKYAAVANFTFLLIASACITLLLLSAKNKQGHRALVATIFFLLSTLYWSLYMQLFISLILFIHYCVTHYFLGIPVNTSQFVSFESVFLLILGVVMGKVWLWLSRKNKPVHDIDKFNVSFILIGCMFLLFYFAIQLTPGTEKIGAWVIILGTFLMAISELALSAIGLSMVTKLAPTGYVSSYIGIWLVTLGFGGKLAGQLSSFIPVSHHVLSSKIAMSHGLLGFIGLSFVGAVSCFLLRKFVLHKTNVIAEIRLQSIGY